MKWRLMYLPWPLKLLIFFGTLIATMKAVGGAPFPVLAVVLLGVCFLLHYVLGPDPSLVRAELRPKR